MPAASTMPASRLPGSGCNRRRIRLSGACVGADAARGTVVASAPKSRKRQPLEETPQGGRGFDPSQNSAWRSTGGAKKRAIETKSTALECLTPCAGENDGIAAPRTMSDSRPRRVPSQHVNPTPLTSAVPMADCVTSNSVFLSMDFTPNGRAAGGKNYRTILAVTFDAKAVRLLVCT